MLITPCIPSSSSSSFLRYVILPRFPRSLVPSVRSFVRSSATPGSFINNPATPGEAQLTRLPPRQTHTRPRDDVSRLRRAPFSKQRAPVGDRMEQIPVQHRSARVKEKKSSQRSDTSLPPVLRVNVKTSTGDNGRPIVIAANEMRIWHSTRPKREGHQNRRTVHSAPRRAQMARRHRQVGNEESHNETKAHSPRFVHRSFFRLARSASGALARFGWGGSA